MALYNTPLEPGLRLTVAPQTNVQVTTPASFNIGYLFLEQGPLGTLKPNALNLITSLQDFKAKIGGVPTTYRQLIDYLSVSAFLDNANGAGLLQVIPVVPPQGITTIGVAFTPTVGSTAATYSATVNGTVINSTVALPASSVAQDLVAADLAAKIAADPILSSVIYIRSVTAGTIELAPLVSSTVLTFSFATPTVGASGTYLVPAASFTTTLNPPSSAQASFVDYGQAVNTVLTDEEPLGFIFAPGFFATETAATGFALASLWDTFCRKPRKQHLAYIDVPNPDSTKVALYSSVTSFVAGSAVPVNALFNFQGNIYKAVNAGISATPPIIAATAVPVANRVTLPQPVTFKGATATVIQSVLATAQIAVPTAPTALELQGFVPIPDTLLIAEELAAPNIEIVERSSASEAGLYEWRNNFNSVEGHLSAVGPYQLYNGLEVSQPYVIPASAYLVGLHIRVANTQGLAAPPASDAYPLISTAGPIWQVTSAGHALLNGRGVNIIKTLNSIPYVMGSRTLSKSDLYNRINNRAILSAYIRTMTLTLSSGIVLRPLDSTGTQLAGIKSLMDRVSEAFYTSGLISGVTSGDAYTNICGNEINPPAVLQQGIVNATSVIQQIGMIEQIRVEISQKLLGT